MYISVTNNEQNREHLLREINYCCLNQSLTISNPNVKLIYHPKEILLLCVDYWNRGVNGGKLLREQNSATLFTTIVQQIKTNLFMVVEMGMVLELPHDLLLTTGKNLGPGTLIPVATWVITLALPWILLSVPIELQHKTHFHITVHPTPAHMPYIHTCRWMHCGCHTCSILDLKFKNTVMHFLCIFNWREGML